MDDVISFMGTGLSPLNMEECDELADYIFRWQLRSSAWLRADKWRQHPEGYGGEYDDETEEKLQRINSLRHIFAKPLIDFQKQSEEASSATEQAQALSDFLENLRMPEKLAKRAAELDEAGFIIASNNQYTSFVPGRPLGSISVRDVIHLLYGVDEVNSDSIENVGDSIAIELYQKGEKGFTFLTMEKLLERI